jgi:anti-sigma regulatory factor (Ser/Thr protein kinase)
VNPRAAASLELTASAGTARPARVAVRDLCTTGDLGEDLSDVAVLLTTELVMNALEHGGGRAIMDAAVDDGGLRVSVVDEDPTVPVALPALEALDEDRGRGLFLVAAMASRWGSRPLGAGKSIWFELDRG